MPSLLVIAALVLVQILFGINYIASKIIVQAFPPVLWASLRAFLVSAFMLSFAALTGRKLPQGKEKYFASIAMFSILGVIINQGSFLLGIHFTTPTNAAVLNTMIPIFTLAVVTIRGQEVLTVRRILGFALSLAGVLSILHLENFSFSDKSLIGDLLMIVNCISFSLFLSFGKKFMESHDPVWTTGWMFAFGSLGLGLISFCSRDWAYFGWRKEALRPLLYFCMAYSVLGGTLLAYFLNFWTLARVRSSLVALFIYVQPVVASVLAVIFFHEKIAVRTAVSSLFIFSGVFFVTKDPISRD